MNTQIRQENMSEISKYMQPFQMLSNIPHRDYSLIAQQVRLALNSGREYAYPVIAYLMKHGKIRDLQVGACAELCTSPKLEDRDPIGLGLFSSLNISQRTKIVQYIKGKVIKLSPMSLEKVNGNVLVIRSQSGSVRIAPPAKKRTKTMNLVSIPFKQYLKERYKSNTVELKRGGKTIVIKDGIEITNKLYKKDKYGTVREYQLEEGMVMVNIYTGLFKNVPESMKNEVLRMFYDESLTDKDVEMMCLSNKKDLIYLTAALNLRIPKKFHDILFKGIKKENSVQKELEQFSSLSPEDQVKLIQKYKLSPKLVFGMIDELTVPVFATLMTTMSDAMFIELLAKIESYGASEPDSLLYPIYQGRLAKMQKNKSLDLNKVQQVLNNSTVVSEKSKELLKTVEQEVLSSRYSFGDHVGILVDVSRSMSNEPIRVLHSILKYLLLVASKSNVVIVRFGEQIVKLDMKSFSREYVDWLCNGENLRADEGSTLLGDAFYEFKEVSKMSELDTLIVITDEGINGGCNMNTAAQQFYEDYPLTKILLFSIGGRKNEVKPAFDRLRKDIRRIVLKSIPQFTEIESLLLQSQEGMTERALVKKILQTKIPKRLPVIDPAYFEREAVPER